MKIEIPENIGKIMDSSLSKDSAKTIIIFPRPTQNTYAMQKGIANAIEYIIQKYDLKLGLQDGAGGYLDALIFRTMPPELKSLWFEQVLMEGKCSGLEAVLHASPPNSGFEAYGIENMALYEESKELLGIVQEKMPSFSECVDFMQKEMAKLRRGDPSLELDKVIKRYKTHKMSLEDFLLQVHEKAKQNGIDLAKDYPCFDIAVNAITDYTASKFGLLIHAASIDLTQSEAEKKEEEEELEKNSHEATISAKDAMTKLANSEQESKLIRHLRRVLCKDEAQRILSDAYANLQALKDITSMEATPELISYFKQNRHEFSSLHFKEILSKHNIFVPEENIKLMDTLSPLMERAYELTSKRQTYFVDKSIEYMNLENDARLAAMLLTGFNVRNTAKLLKQRGLSYYVVFPNLVKPKTEINELKAAPLIGTPPHAKQGVLSAEERGEFQKMFPRYACEFIPIRNISKGCYKKAVQLRNPKKGDFLTLKIADLTQLTERALHYIKLKGFSNPVEAFENEASRMMVLRDKKSPYISNIIGASLSPGNRLYLFLEEYSERTLLDYVRENHPLSDCLVNDFAVQLAKGLSLIHDVGLYHGDPKPDNILFRNGILAYTDFDLASTIPEEGKVEDLATYSCVIAPELFKNAHQSPVSDIWAYGVNVFFMKKNAYPFPIDCTISDEEMRVMSFDKRSSVVKEQVYGKIQDERYYKGVLDEIDSMFDPKLAEIIKRCLDINPGKRFENGCQLYDALMH
jgi:hypothetical protein